jgi:GNAT superfamily N-acetyltransferase
MQIRTAHPDELDRMVAIDDDACALYAEAGIDVLLPDDHPFVVDEKARWLASARAGTALLAMRDGRAVGFAAIGRADGAAYVDQLSVRRDAMRTGVGTALLSRAVALGTPLWLTTYAHLPWNGPWYARCGFRVVPESECGPQIRHHLAQQRAALPAPDQRIAMCRARIA